MFKHLKKSSIILQYIYTIWIITVRLFRFLHVYTKQGCEKCERFDYKHKVHGSIFLCIFQRIGNI